MDRLLMFTVLLLGAGVSAAIAEPYWVTYEANDLPENEGWERLYQPVVKRRFGGIGGIEGDGYSRRYPIPQTAG